MRHGITHHSRGVRLVVLVLVLTHVACHLVPRRVLEVILEGNGDADPSWLVLQSTGEDCAQSYALEAVKRFDIHGDLIHTECLPRIAVFSQENAGISSLLAQPLADRLRLPLGQLVRIPVDVWINASEPSIQSKVEDEIANANWIFNTNKVGVAFDASYHDFSGTCQPEGEYPFCQLQPTCRPSETYPVPPYMTPWYSQGRVNIYVLDNAPNETCDSSVVENVILISPTAQLGVLVHELGHLSGLVGMDGWTQYYESGHVNWHPGFTCHNVMWTLDNMLETRLSIGQIFWMNFSCDSFLSKFKARSVPRVPCFECKGKSCPPWDFDVGQAGATGDVPIEPSVQHILEEWARCNACDKERLQLEGLSEDEAVKLLKSIVSLGVGPSQCTTDEIRADLQGRFATLRKYGLDHSEAVLGSADAATFVNRYLGRYETVIYRKKAVEYLTRFGETPGRTRDIIGFFEGVLNGVVDPGAELRSSIEDAVRRLRR